MESEKSETQSHHAQYIDRDEIFLAAASGDLVAVATSLAQGAALMAADNKGRTALHLASQNGHYSMVKALLQSRASVEAKDNDGRTALALAT